MTISVVLPPQLRELVGGAAFVPLDGELETVAKALEALRVEAPAVYDRMLTEEHQLRPHLNVFVGDEDIRWSGGLQTPLRDGSEVVVLTAVSGG